MTRHRTSEDNLPLFLPGELDAVATRVRKYRENMSATILEIGRELRAVKRRQKRDQFPGWLTAACELTPLHAELMMRAAQWAEGREEIVSNLEPTAIYLLAAPSTPKVVRQEVLFRLKNGQRPTFQFIKGMIRAAKGDPSGALPDSAEEALEGFLKYCGYKTIPDHLAPLCAPPPTKRKQRPFYQSDAGLAPDTMPVAARTLPSANDLGLEEPSNVL